MIMFLVGSSNLMVADPPRPGDCEDTQRPEPWGCEENGPKPLPGPGPAPDCALTPPYVCRAQ